jgi:hypothetical protein
VHSHLRRRIDPRTSDAQYVARQHLSRCNSGNSCNYPKLWISAYCNLKPKLTTLDSLSANQAWRQRGGGQVRLGGIRPVSRTDTHRSHANADIAVLDASPRQWRRVGFAKRSSGVRARIDPFKRASGNLTHAFVPRRIHTPPRALYGAQSVRMHAARVQGAHQDGGVLGASPPGSVTRSPGRLRCPDGRATVTRPSRDRHVTIT